MDALAMYGSDSDDDSDSDVGGNKRSKFLVPRRMGGALSLLGKSDSLSSEDEDIATIVKDERAVFRAQEGPILSNSKHDPSTNPSPSWKRQKIEDKSKDSLSVPSPTLKQQPSSSCANVDHVSTDSTQASHNDNSVDWKQPPLYSKFRTLASSLPTGKSWAQILRKQKEFHNPHFFQSVVEYYEISQPFGSHLVREEDELVSGCTDEKKLAAH